MTDEHVAGGTEQYVTGHLWWSNYLEVGVHDAHVGRTFRVQFTQAVDGLLKESGGGAYGPGESDRFEFAQKTARTWISKELGYTVTDKKSWSRTKATRGMAYRDRQELMKLSEEQRQELAQKLRRGEIKLSESDDGRTQDTDTGHDGGEADD